MSAGNHKIQRIVLEIVNTDRESYKADEQHFSDLVNGSLTKALEQLLDETGVEEEIIRIPKLDLNLGFINRPFNEAVIIAVFKEQLKTQLNQLVQSKEIAKEPTENEGNEVDALMCFFKTGTLPWWTTTLPDINKWKEPGFKNAISRYLFSEATRAAQERLLKQFTNAELRIILESLVVAKDKETLARIDQIIERLITSTNFEKQRSGKLLIEKSVKELMDHKGSLDSYEGFITDFINEDEELQKLTLHETAEYLGDTDLTKLEELKALKAEQRFTNVSAGDISFKKDQESEGKEAVVLHYLTYGSFPLNAPDIKREELFYLIKEVLLNKQAAVAAVLKDNISRQNAFIYILLSLPGSYFTNILNAILRKAGNVKETIKKQLRDTFSSANPGKEIKTFAALLTVNQLLKNTDASINELYKHSIPFISNEEKLRLKDYLSEEVPELNDINEAQITSEPDESIDAGYFYDLLNFLITYNAWPWWGNRYLRAYGKPNADAIIENEVINIIGHFKTTYPNEYTDFSKAFLKENTKPSALLSALNWNTSLQIIDSALPYFRNSFSESLEAVIALLSAHKGLGLHPKIVTQQVLLFMIDHQTGKAFNFKESMNEVITLIAGKFKIHLWEVYGILVKNYNSLNLKNPLSKTEALSLFDYHESLEEQYASISQHTKSNTDFTVKHILDVDLISEKHEAIIIEYLSGNVTRLNVFPSSNALGEFIKERIKQSAGFASLLKGYITGSDFKVIYRLIQLEKISKTDWLAWLLDQKEQVILQSDLYELLKNTNGINKYTLKALLRAVFIKESYWSDVTFTAPKFKTLLKTIAEETGITSAALELKIVQGLSGETANYNSFQNLILENEKFNEEVKGTDQIIFPGEIEDATIKSQIALLNGVFRDIPDQQTASEFITGLKTIKGKSELISWIEKKVYFDGKKELLNFIETLNEPVDINSFIKRLIETISLNSITSNKRLSTNVVSAVITYVQGITNFSDKNSLLGFLETDQAFDQRKLIAFIETLPGFTNKQTLLDFVNKETESLNFPNSVVSPKQIERFNLWKETLGFDVSLPEIKEQNKNNEKDSAKDSITKEDIHITQENREERSINDATITNSLSPNSIIDIALYFFFNNALPWWSPTKELSVFEKLFRNIVITSPFVFTEKLIDAAGYYPGFFPELAAMIIASTNTAENKSEKLKAQTSELVKNDIVYLDQLFLREPKISVLKTLIDEIVLRFNSINIDPDQLPDVFRQTASLILYTADPKINELFQTTNEPESSLVFEKWKTLLTEITKEKQGNASRSYPLLQVLKELEQSFILKEPRNDLSVTDRAFFVFNSKYTFSTQDFLETWLVMLEAATGSSYEILQQEVIQKMAASTSYKDDLEKNILQTMSSLSIEENAFHTPYTYYTVSIGLILNMTDTLSSLQKRTALKLFTELVQIETLAGDLSIPFGVFLKYLNDNGLSSSEFIRMAEEVKTDINKTEVKQSIDSIINMAHELYVEKEYAGELQSQKETDKQSTLPLSEERAIEEIIKGINNGAPLLQLVKDRAKDEKQLQDKKNSLRSKAGKEELDIDLTGRIYIPNAGLIILWPFLTRLFTNLKYIEEGKFVNTDMQQRAIHMTQYMVNFSEDHPEYTLMLNKLICGVELTVPIERMISLTEEEKSEAQNLIKAVLAQWKEMTNTTVENFQRTFIQREGVMYQKDGNWYINVNKTAFDVLLLKLPWGLSIIKYPWNNYLIFVEWKAMS